MQMSTVANVVFESDPS